MNMGQSRRDVPGAPSCPCAGNIHAERQTAGIHLLNMVIPQTFSHELMCLMTFIFKEEQALRNSCELLRQKKMHTI